MRLQDFIPPLLATPFDLPIGRQASLRAGSFDRLWTFCTDEAKIGFMGIDEQTVHEIVRRILSVAAPDKIILFGSAATGEMTRDSDVDLLIVESDTSRQREEYVRIIRALWDIRYPFDVLFIATQWFEESKDIVGGIAYPANKYGKVIYDAA